VRMGGGGGHGSCYMRSYASMQVCWLAMGACFTPS
jgi:hypothetical protein